MANVEVSGYEDAETNRLRVALLDVLRGANPGIALAALTNAMQFTIAESDYDPALLREMLLGLIVLPLATDEARELLERVTRAVTSGDLQS